MIFVLSDGETNRGHSMNEIKTSFRHLEYQYTQSAYNADIQACRRSPASMRLASINADTDDVVYKLANMFNAEL